MTIDARDGICRFNSLVGSGPRVERVVVVFPRPVTQAVAVIKGFDVAFTRGGGDHHLGQLEVGLSALLPEDAPRRVEVEVTYGLRDWSNSWDDPYEGTIQFTVVATLEDPPSPGPVFSPTASP